MQRQAKGLTPSLGAIRTIALAMFVALSLLSHFAAYGAYGAQADVPAPAAHVHAAHAMNDCPGEGCPRHYDVELGCCALGYCGAPLPKSDCAAQQLSPAPTYSQGALGIAPRWNSMGVDRPPKSA